MKEIIGDDYPTYEDSVNMTLAESSTSFNNSTRSANRGLAAARALRVIFMAEDDLSKYATSAL